MSMQAHMVALENNCRQVTDGAVIIHAAYKCGDDEYRDYVDTCVGF